MRCEVCGRNIRGKPFHVLIEGAKLLVCSECSKHGTLVSTATSNFPEDAKIKMSPDKAMLAKAKVSPRKSEKLEVSMELVDDFTYKIRQAREKLGLTHEELGKRINEKASVLKKIESGKMVPDDRLVAKLEHALRIRLMSPVSDVVPKAAIPKPPARGLTLSDLIRLNGKNNGEAEEN
ncbi:MAG: multiprotein bridging factor aMBF1 [Candidatus Bathyarchaeota archaeon]|nr:multiprotein bridging factor aMBF1 [Candidatus Bathyarchaeota archaeon]MCX8177930.1 multiprotein bridging factor aMBF1 [Candidatus Bathyarchaeota archaeon]MDW8194249.1 multiprotein bridging factor aMBF1 [Nitrososphaerota archaeon]